MSKNAVKILSIAVFLMLITASVGENTGLLASINISYSENYIEIFDINESRVVKVSQSSTLIQREVEKYLSAITSINLKFRPIPDKGFMARIPLEPGVEVQNQWFTGLVNEVIIIFPELGKPYLLVFDNQNKPLFFNFEVKTDVLLENLNFSPKVSQ